ncbi:MAG: CNNM domain-containing protein [Arenicellaceae bacterium]|nr:CNNM domain-containing protein [Arenicellaceae bacterium]
MQNIPTEILALLLVALIVTSACFSASETAMMAINRYRIKHKAQTGHRPSILIDELLQAPDRLLSTILIGNNIANISATALATIIGLKLYGDVGIAIATAILVLIILVFAEVAPKTLAATRPELIAYPAAYVLKFLQTAFSPVIWLVNICSNRFLKIFGVSLESRGSSLNPDELRAAVIESKGLINENHHKMLLRIFEFDKMCVDDVMVPRQELETVDINDSWEEVVDQLATSHHTRILIYKDHIDNLLGVIHMRQLFHLSQSPEGLNCDTVTEMIQPPYFLPESTTLSSALLQLQEQKYKFGVVVDEYGDIEGIITIEEIIEEIVGDFTMVLPGLDEGIKIEEDGSFLASGSVNLRELNRQLNWNLPTDGAKTLNGLILDYLEDIPQPATTVRLGDFLIEIIQTRGTAVTETRLRKA